MSRWNYPGCAIRPATEASKTRKTRRKREKKHARFGGSEFEAYVHALPDCVDGSRDVQAAHLNHAGAGGTDRDAHTDNIVPLSVLHHVELDTGPKGQWPSKRAAFEAKYKIDLSGIARVVTQGFKNNWPPEKVRRRWREYGGR